METYKLVVFMIAAVAVIYIIVTLFSPYLIPRKNVFDSIEDSLTTAEGFKGEFNAKTILYPPNLSFKASSFDTVSRSVNFSCNEGALCCSKGEECGRIEWDERYIFFPQSGKVITSTRCDYAHGLFACTVYFGSEPAQLELKNLPKKINFDFNAGSPLALEIDIGNSGEKQALSLITTSIKIYQETIIQGEKQKTFRHQDSKTIETLAKGASHQEKFSIPLENINENGTYVIEVRTEGRDSGFDEAVIDLVVSNAAQAQCVAERTGPPYLDEDTCKRNLYCKDCSLAVQCSQAWGQKLGGFFEIVDPEYTYQTIPLSECG